MKFKKHIVILLAFLVLVSNVGFAFNVHYCDDRIASVSLNTIFPDNLEENCCGVVEQNSHCCKDRTVVIQKKSDQAVVKSFSLQLDNAVLAQQWIPIAQTTDVFFEHTNPPAYYCDSHAPPLFKLYSQYIFYERFNVFSGIHFGDVTN